MAPSPNKSVRENLNDLLHDTLKSSAIQFVAAMIVVMLVVEASVRVPGASTLPQETRIYVGSIILAIFVVWLLFRVATRLRKVIELLERVLELSERN